MLPEHLEALYGYDYGKQKTCILVKKFVPLTRRFLKTNSNTMAKYKAKTTETKLSVQDFIKKIPDAQRQKDALAIVDLMQMQSGFPPKMWGPAIIGFGSYHYVYDSGHEGDAPLIGFSPRKAEFALYLSSAFDKREELLKQFGKHKTAKSCIYIKKMEDINVEIFKKMLANALKFMKTKNK
jgi:hypothetical protein